MFKFSLQPVLEQRLMQEEKRQREFSETQQLVETLNSRQRSIEQGIARRSQQVRERQMLGQRFAEREIFERWIGGQQVDLRQVAEQREHLVRKLEELRQRLVEAMRQRKIMEKLREREHETFRVEEARAERRLFDDLALRDFNMQLRWEKDSSAEERIAR